MGILTGNAGSHIRITAARDFRCDGVSILRVLTRLCSHWRAQAGSQAAIFSNWAENNSNTSASLFFRGVALSGRPLLVGWCHRLCRQDNNSGKAKSIHSVGGWRGDPSATRGYDDKKLAVDFCFSLSCNSAVDAVRRWRAGRQGERPMIVANRPPFSCWPGQ